VGGVAKWSRTTNSWTTVLTTPQSGLDRGTAAIDPSGNGTLLRVGEFGAPNVPVAIDLASGVLAAGHFTGPYASAVNIGDYYAAGLVFDRGLSKFILFQDDGNLYTIKRVSNDSWYVDRLPLSGSAPAAYASTTYGAPYVAIWGRLQY